ncbi:putative E3 ubiquitin-protein ligase TRAIP-like [Cocos nucifera]|uniref:Putative E3 ubiquitin-protein ligase TRAIP-like n=1 Tax=Cocos nucifera TaxID=13894 RepID=A0A8K0IJ38_COCNU|nr:putative E3 ubiquitin-protein ligase TRAIP-like [Cocos nucifera]
MIAASKPICTICYEDLNLIVEEVQAIPICGHVFHELCIQQWLEYCPEGKKPTCPVCKQFCAHHSPIRLYFQSTGDPSQIPLSQKLSSEADAEALAEEVRRLELKLSALSSNFENQQKHLSKLNDEVTAWKELAKKEEARRGEIMKEKECTEQFLHMKMEELSRKSLECTKLHERSLGLAKELAALKLATDMNLEEEEMVKLASLGHGNNHENAVQVLKRSLALRNKSYKELLARCNLLGRAETRSQMKLDKAKEKIRKLQARLQEVEKALEEKENEILRNLKASKRTKTEGISFSCVNEILNYPCTDYHLLEDQTEKRAEVPDGSNKISFSKNNLHHFKGSAKGSVLQNNLISSGFEDNDNVIDLDADTSFFMDEVALEPSTNLFKHSTPISDGKNQAESNKNADFHKSSMSAQGAAYPNKEASSTYKHSRHEPWNSGININNDEKGSLERVVDRSAAQIPSTEASSTYKHVRHESWNSGINMKNDEKGSLEKVVDGSGTQMASSSQTKEILLIDDITRQSPSMAIKRETQDSDSVASPGGNRSVGKWCKQVPSVSSYLRMQASKRNGDLIAVGADGRGGRVKVLRAHDQLQAFKRVLDLTKTLLPNLLHLRSYKELLARCNLLGRAETRSQMKLDKAKEKIRKLQARLQEVEKALEEKENEILRNLKASKRTKTEGISFSCVNEILNYPCTDYHLLEDQTEKRAEVPDGSNKISFSKNNLHHFKGSAKGSVLQNNLISSGFEDNDNVIDLDADTSFFMDEVALEPSTNLFKHSTPISDGKNQAESNKNADFHKSSMSAQGAAYPNKEASSTYKHSRHEPWNSGININNDEKGSLERVVDRSAAQIPSTEASSTYKHVRHESWNSGINMKNDEKGSLEKVVDGSGTQMASSSQTKEILLIDDITRQSPSMAIKRETQDSDSVASPGGNRSVGKWCKQVPSVSSYLRMQASKRNGDLIAVGADGRGGRVKVLRAHDQVNKSQTSWSKSNQHGAKQSGQSQIDHFFVKSEG